MPPPLAKAVVHRCWNPPYVVGVHHAHEVARGAHGSSALVVKHSWPADSFSTIKMASQQLRCCLGAQTPIAPVKHHFRQQQSSCVKRRVGNTCRSHCNTLTEQPRLRSVAPGPQSCRCPFCFWSVDAVIVLMQIRFADWLSSSTGVCIA